MIERIIYRINPQVALGVSNVVAEVLLDSGEYTTAPNICRPVMYNDEQQQMLIDSLKPKKVAVEKKVVKKATVKKSSKKSTKKK